MAADGDRSLAGRSVVVTGAAGGIGSAVARRFARAGARLALLDLDGAGAEALAAELGDAGREALARACDVTSPSDARAAVDAVCARWGGVDVLVANAGITHLSPIRATSVDVLRRVMDVNFYGAVHCTQAALESLVSRRGRIVVLSSVAGFAPLATRSGYAASKHALHGLFESLRVELRPTGVSVTLVCPFFVRTAIGDHALGGDGGPPRVARTQTGRAMEPDRLADQIYRATLARRRLLLGSGGARLARVLSRLSPALYENVMRRRLVED